MSILNVNQIQPVGSGQTVTISAANITASSSTITANTFSGSLSSSGVSTFSDTVNVGAGKSIRLYGASSGYSQIVAAAGSASTTFTLPANGGSSGQYLQTNGSGGLSWAGAGKILQVVQTEKTDVSSSVTGTTWTDFGLSVNITPSSTSNKILILCKLQVSNGNGYDVRQRLMRDSTPIFIGDAAGSRPQASSTYIATYYNNYSSLPVSISYLDSPSTTSQVTYKVQGANYTSGTVWLNRGPNDQDNVNYESRTASSIIVMEVAG